MHDTALIDHISKLARQMRRDILRSTTEAGSGHPSSSLSAVELMAGLFFGGFFRFFPDNPGHACNDRLIFSKGHASPLLYALWAAAGQVTEQELLRYRTFESPLEGHPSTAFRFTEAATGSLGQGLSIGLGMALNGRLFDKLPYRTFVLMGDSEMAEGSSWEAMQLAAHHGLDNLVGIIDVNRLGQRGETMQGYDIGSYAARVSAFGWETVVIEDGHDIAAVLDAYARATRAWGRPVMLIARTVKGKGVALMENKNGWHGKALSKEQCEQALHDLGPVDERLRGELAAPEDALPAASAPGDGRPVSPPNYEPEARVATREAYGHGLARLYPATSNMVVLDGEVSNSTHSDIFKKAYPERFIEMYIAEQNMAGVGLGLARRGKLPFLSTFAAFLSRAFDQIRMSQYSEPHIIYCGSHAGVSIGQDGPSQMALEDIAFFRTLLHGVVLYPSDAVSCDKLVERAASHQGMVYIRTTRAKTPLLYGPDESFPIGGCKVLRQGEADEVTLIGAGITLHECLAAHDILAAEGIRARVIDLYSVRPLDEQMLRAAARQTGAIVTVEDHGPAGGLGEAVLAALADLGEERVPVQRLAVRKKPKSGTPEELLAFMGIDREAIAAAARQALGRS